VARRRPRHLQRGGGVMAAADRGGLDVVGVSGATALILSGFVVAWVVVVALLCYSLVLFKSGFRNLGWLSFACGVLVGGLVLVVSLTVPAP
jgi:hypothetical protein